ncbi:SHOCT domain-containing protein [Candidatus Solincola sp.]|nr:SHOCT domain-containing protein [Actinomycetota bacterium]MDI7251859.1 SHOCT domain-containing protein [Actinomycetota bacterium]
MVAKRWNRLTGRTWRAFTNIGNPREVRELILNQRNIFLERRSGRAPVAGTTPPPAPSPEPSPGERGEAASGTSVSQDLELVEGLHKLDELRRSGALSEEEFERAKKELLEKLEGR